MWKFNGRTETVNILARSVTRPEGRPVTIGFFEIVMYTTAGLGYAGRQFVAHVT